MKLSMDLLKNKRHIFITGTDTHIGKTTFTIQLLNFFNQQNLSTVSLKPIATGCKQTPDGLRNNDALLLQHTASIKLPYAEVNPFAFAEPISPNIAAEKIGFDLNVKNILQTCKPTLNHSADRIVIEGVGGLLVPLNNQETLANLIKAFNFPIILVVGIRLGCLNHALLTAEMIKMHKIELIGWVANCLDDSMLCLEENITTLEKYIDAPLLCRIDKLTSPIYPATTFQEKLATT